MSAVRHVMLYAANALNFLCRPTDSSSAGICEPDMVRSADEKSARSTYFAKLVKTYFDGGELFSSTSVA